MTSSQPVALPARNELRVQFRPIFGSIVLYTSALSSNRCAPQEREGPERIVRQVHQPARLVPLRLGDCLEAELELRVLHEHVSMDAEEACQERLHGLKVAVTPESRRQGAEEGVQVRERRERAQLEVCRGGRERLEVLEEGLIWRVRESERYLARTGKESTHNPQPRPP